MRYCFIVNPLAGGGRGARAWEAVEADLRRSGAPYEVHVTKAPGEGEAIARERAGEASSLVAVGGDGTLHEVGNGLMQRALSAGGPAPALGWVPAGTGNDLARTLGIPLSPRQALALILSGTLRRVDVGQVNDRCFFNVSGVGFDARVAEAVSRRNGAHRGAFAYAAAALRLLPRLENPYLELRGGDLCLGGRLLLVAVGNCRYYGGGMLICPQARADDGLLDVCVAGDLRRREVLRALGAAFRGSHVGLPKFGYHTLPELEIDGPADVLVHADGQVVGTLPVRYKVLPGALHFHCRP